MWIEDAAGGERQLTGEFPSGLGYSSLDWASSSVPAGSPAPAPDLLTLTATGELKLGDDAADLTRTGTPDSVSYRTDVLCDYDASTTTTTFTVWTPAAGQTTTTDAGCLDWPPDGYAFTQSLAAWTAQVDLNGDETLTATRIAPATTPATSSWTSGREAPDIGWRASIGGLVSDGSDIFFSTENDYDKPQLWRIADSDVLHAAGSDAARRDPADRR